MTEHEEELTPAEELAPAEEPTEREILVDEIIGRSEMYRLLYKLFYWPLSEAEIDAIDIDWLQELSTSEEVPLMAAGFNDMYRHLRRRNTGTREDLNADFTRAFMGQATYKGLACQPYASLFVSNAGQIMGEPRNRARATYKQHCIKLADGIDLPEDHLAFESEFMAIMGERAAEALQNGDDAAALEALEVQEAFLNDQVLPWVGRFFDLSAEVVRTRFYRGVVKMSRGFLESDTWTLDDLKERVQELEAA